MAPTRRKYADKSTASDVRRRWKAGDLVLAKVKGFPSWPATVSEPQKWGYPADLKKVLVYFFGTQQIAVCNPADVEEFTEDKKVYLLGRRRGKGSDFVRALEEIVDCFEKLKKQGKDSSDNLIEETAVTTENNSIEPLTKSVNGEAPAITVKQHSRVATNDLICLTEAAVAAAADDALLENMQSGEAHSYSGYTKKRVFSTRSKNDTAPSDKVDGQRRTTSRNLRVSSRKNYIARQISMLPCTNNIRSSRQLVTNALQDRSLRSRRVMGSLDDSEEHIPNASDFVSSETMKENDSDVVSVGSDTHSFNNGSSVDLGCRPVEERHFHEINEGKSVFSDRLDFQVNANVLKKKRKPIRKRPRYEIASVAKLDNVISGNEVCKTESPTHKMKVAESDVKENGDEHLPLVKRARARMGRPSPTVTEEKRLEVSESFAVQSFGILNCNDVGESIPVNVGLVNSLLPPRVVGKSQSRETRKNLVDGEASLPPSKRLHRALQAMSANVAEDSERTSSTLLVNDRSNVRSSSSAEFAEIPIIKEAAIVSRSGLVENHTHNVSHSSAPEFCVGLNIEVLKNDHKAPEIVSSSCKTSPCADGPNPELCKDSLEHAQGAESGDELPSLKDHPIETVAEHQHLHETSNPPIIGGELSELNCYPPCVMMSLDECKVEPAELKEITQRPAPDNSQKNSGSVVVKEILCASPNNEIGIQMGGLDVGGYETQMENNLCLFKDKQDSQRSEFMGEDIPVSTYSTIAPAANPVNVLASDLLSTSVSGDHLEDRVLPFTQSSNPSVGSNYVAKTPPHGSSVSIISASDNTSNVEKNNSCCDVQSHPGNAELTGKSSSKHELMLSFEAIIKCLTRTKDIIGRATRIAIDCAKAGIATKVMEVLSCNLESESNPHKKIDLFFLVDSITQCSGGMTGDAGVYPSAIQELLSRLLLAAAPPGSCFHENHRQCLKVLRVWLDRKILPEPIITHHIRELEFLYDSHVTSVSSRSCRFERPFDDPIREMKDMLVDEYGSNSSIQLPGFCMPALLRDSDSGSDSDGDNFEAVTPEHNVENLNGETNQIAAVEKRSHILEDVDGELEMEDVAPICEVEINSTSNIAQANCTQTPNHHSGNLYSEPARLPKYTQLKYLPLPPSPPPPPPLPPSGFPPAVLDSVSNFTESNIYSSSQEPQANSSSPRVKPRYFGPVHHRLHENKDSEPLFSRQMRYSNNNFPLSDQPTSHFSARVSDGFQSVDDGKGFHLHPPHPALSNQFSYVRDQRNYSRKDVPTTARPSRYHSRNTDYYRDRDMNRGFQRDDIGEYWRPPLPSVSGRYYPNSSRMSHAPMLHYGPPREPEVPYNRLSFPPRYVGRRKFSPYSPPSEGPIPVTNRGFWKPR